MQVNGHYILKLLFGISIVLFLMLPFDKINHLDSNMTIGSSISDDTIEDSSFIVDNINSNGGVNIILNSPLDSTSKSFEYTPKDTKSITIKQYSLEPYSLLEDDFIEDATILDVPYTYQAYRYPTGCESVSAVSVLQYYGLDISVDDFIDQHLNKSELTVIGYNRYGDKILQGPHPNKSFIGNPKSAEGLGCYENTIVEAINSVLDEYQISEYFKVEAHRNLTMQDVTNYLDNGVPVIIWATQNMVDSECGLTWYITGTDTIFQYMKNEHCLVAIGHNDQYIFFNDSLVGKVAYPISLVQDRYAQMNYRTVTIEYIDHTINMMNIHKG